MRKIEFFGHTKSKDGIRPSEDKVKAIKDFAVPSKTKEVSSFPGTITYFAKFIPNLSSKTETLRRLLHKDQKFIWGQEENDVFIHLKSKLCSDSHGTFQHITKNITNRRRRSGRFRCHTGTGITRWNYSSSSICKSYPNSCLRLQSYLYNIVYIPGKSKPADILSIKPLQVNDKDTQLSDRTEAVINALISYNVPKTITLSEVLQASKTDNELTMVGKCVISGKWEKTTY